MMANMFFRMKMKCSFTKLTLLLLFITVTTFSFAVLDENYVSSDNLYCDYDNTIVQWISVFNAQDVSQMENCSQCYNDLTTIAQKVNTETYGWENYPFLDSSGDPWSDTWGICVYFEGNESSQEYGITGSLPNYNSAFGIASYIFEENSHNWTILIISGFSDDYAGYLGLTLYQMKFTYVTTATLNQNVLHEFGHTGYSSGYLQDPATVVGYDSTGIYYWYCNNHEHYGQYPVPQQNYDLNFMHFDTNCGFDGDYNYKNPEFPFFPEHFGDSYRFDIQWD